MRLVTLFIIALLCYQPVSAQDDYTIEHFTDENGLPQNSVKSLALDAGFLWLATENGPVRYDGKTFLLFDKNATGSTSNRVLDFKKDAAGQLYAHSENGQLLPISRGAIRRPPVLYDSVFQVPGYKPTGFYPASGLPNMLDMYLEGMPYIIPRGPERYYKIYRDTVHLYVRHREVRKFFYSVPSQQRLFLLGDALYYMDNSRRVYPVAPGAGPMPVRGDLPAPGPGRGKLFWNYSTGQIFLAVNNSLFLLEKTGTNEITSTRILGGVSLEAQDVLAVHYDRTNRKVFVGTMTNGLYIYTLRQFQALGTANYYAQAALPDNSVLFANGDLVKRDGTLARMELVGKYATRPYALLTDSVNNIWMMDRMSVHCLSPDGKRKLFTIEFPYFLHSLYRSPDNTIWAGTTDAVFRLERLPDGRYVKKLFSSLKNVFCMQQDGDNLWLGTSHGLFRKNIRTKQLTRYRSFGNKYVRSIYLKDHQAWIATYGDGLYVVSDNGVKRVPPDRNNYLNTPHCILEDKQGFFWISTNKGLFKALAADLVAYVNGKVKTVYYQFYNKDFGFNTNEFNGGCQPCASILPDSSFIYPTIKGAVKFTPSAISSSFPDKEIFIDKIDVDERTDFDASREIRLSQGYNQLSVHFSSPYFGSPENLNFQYKLDNDSVWRPASGPSVSYSSLPYGRHELQIRKLSGFGPDNFTYKTVRITILPYFYETWWFRVLLAIAAVIGIYLFIRLRTRIIRKRNEQLETSISERTNELILTINAYESAKNLLERQSYFQRRLITAITHDIKSPLKYLMKTGESLYRSRDDDTANKNGLKAIYDSSFQMYHFTDNLLDYAKGFLTDREAIQVSVDLHRLVEDKIAIFHHLAASHHTLIRNEIRPGTMVSTNPQLLAVILHNLLDNAIKFTASGEVTFDCHQRAHGTEIEVRDTGAGLTEAQVQWFNDTHVPAGSPNNDGLGLIMIREMAHIINATVRVESRKGMGTVFRIFISS